MTTARARYAALAGEHDTILVYVKDARDYWFDSAEVDREPYMALGLVNGREGGLGQAADRRLVAHDRADERAREDGLPDAEAVGIVRRMVLASTRPGDWCLDFFAGSGTLGAVAAGHGRHYVLIDSNLEAVRVMERRLVALPFRIESRVNAFDAVFVGSGINSLAARRCSRRRAGAFMCSNGTTGSAARSRRSTA